MGETNDLITLTHLHEPAILHALHCRYRLDTIYTFTGPILLAINPFRALPLYTPEILNSYYVRGMLRSQGIEDEASASLPPHQDSYTLSLSLSLPLALPLALALPL